METSGKPVVIGMILTAVAFAVLLGPDRARRIRELARIETDIHEIRAEGAAFAEGKPPEACTTQALQTAATCDDADIPCTARAGLFLEGCLGALVLPLTFCEGAPAPDPPDWKADETQAWLEARCVEAGYPQRTACARVLHDGLLRACSAAPDAETATLEGDTLEVDEF